jgi:hypothetical protein
MKYTRRAVRSVPQKAIAGTSAFAGSGISRERQR